MNIIPTFGVKLSFNEKIIQTIKGAQNSWHTGT